MPSTSVYFCFGWVQFVLDWSKTFWTWVKSIQWIIIFCPLQNNWAGPKPKQHIKGQCITYFLTLCVGGIRKYKCFCSKISHWTSNSVCVGSSEIFQLFYLNKSNSTVHRDFFFLFSLEKYLDPSDGFKVRVVHCKEKKGHHSLRWYLQPSIKFPAIILHSAAPVSEKESSGSHTDPLLIYTWILKFLVWKINFDELDFLSSSNLMFYFLCSLQNSSTK